VDCPTKAAITHRIYPLTSLATLSISTSGDFEVSWQNKKAGCFPQLWSGKYSMMDEGLSLDGA
jgi:hypothetical protein